MSKAGAQDSGQSALDNMRKSSPSRRGAGTLRGTAAMYPRGESVQQLKALFDKLSVSPQGTGEQYDSSIRAAANEAFVGHPESDVRLWSAKCLVEALRIYAPNQPFDDPALLRKLLLLILEQIGILREPSSPMFAHALDIVQKLVDFNGLMLIFECADQEELLVTLVARCIGAAHATKIHATKNDNSHMFTLISQVLERTLAEADDIPQCALVTLVEELMPERRSTRGRELAARVLGTLAQGGAALSINEFLNAALYTGAVSKIAHPLQAWASEEHRDTLLEIAAELFRIDSALTARVIPNLQSDLESGDVQRRQGATSCVGQMLAHYAAGSATGVKGLPLMGTNPRLLDKFLERLHDADEHVRKNAIDGAAAILATAAATDERDPATAVLSDAAKMICDELKDRCLDPSEEVRVRVVQVVADIALSVRGFNYLKRVLPVAFQRILDKKLRVREMCIEGCGKVYSKHALPAWLEGRREQAMQFAFIPQTLFEAHSVFTGGRLGHTDKIEACVEQDILGITSSAAHRGRALAGLLSCVAGHGAAEKGLHQLLEKKREGHAALRRFLSVRLAKGAKSAPVLTTGGVAACFAPAAVAAIEDAADGAPEPSESAASIRTSALQSLGSLARISPFLEDKTILFDHTEDFKNLDLIRDRDFWILLHHLTDPVSELPSSDVNAQITKLKELVDRKNIPNLWPLLRRCLVASWLLPDQVASLLMVWSTSLADDCEMAMVAQRAMSILPRYFPGAFLPHVPSIAEHLDDPSTASVEAALRALAAIGKRRAAVSPTSIAGAAGLGDPKGFAERLLIAVEGVCEEEDESRYQGSMCRKVVRALGIFEPDAAWIALEKLMDWAEYRPTGSSIALRLVAAARDWLLHMPSCPDRIQSRVVALEWVNRACRVLLEPLTPENQLMQSAAAELLVAAGPAAGAEKELLALFARKTSDSALCMTPGSSDDVQLLHPEGMLLLHSSLATLRGIRRGTLPLTTDLLKCVTAQASNVFSSERSPHEIEALLKELQQLQKQTSSLSSVLPLKFTARLRLCATLPTLFAKAATKSHREAALRILQTCLAKAIRQMLSQSGEKQLQLLDYAVACFVHFLSRVPAFVEEANMALTAFVESSSISAFFVEALLRTDPSRSADLATAVLKVTGRVQHFVDCDDPTSDKIHKAAYVLKHVMEKRCPELGKLDVKLQGGGLPAELFSVPPPPRIAGEASQIADAKRELPPRENKILNLDRHVRKDIVGGSRPALPIPHGQQVMSAAKPSATPRTSKPAATIGQMSSSSKSVARLQTSSPQIPQKQQQLSFAKSKTPSTSSSAVIQGGQSVSAKADGPAKSASASSEPRSHVKVESGSGVSVAPASSDLPITRLSTPTGAEDRESPALFSDIHPRHLSYSTGRITDNVLSGLRRPPSSSGKRESLEAQIENTESSSKRPRRDDKPPEGPPH